MNLHLSVRYQVDSEIVVVDATGRLTHGEADCEFRALISDLLGEGYRHIVLNLSQASYIDSSMLGALVAARMDMESNGGQLKLASLRPRAGDLLQLTKLHVAFAIFPDEASALASFGPPPPRPTSVHHRQAA